MYKVIPTTEEHIDLLINDIRNEDMEEIDALTGEKMKIALMKSFNSSQEVWTAFAPEGVICIFGLGKAALLSKRACPWIISTSLVDRHRKAFMKGTKIAVDYWANQGHDLEAYIDNRYKKALRWVEKIGFTVHPPGPYGAYGMPFNKVTLRK